MNYAKVVFEQARDAMPFPDLHELARSRPAILGEALREGTLLGQDALRRLVHAEYVTYCILPTLHALFGRSLVRPRAHIQHGIDFSGLALVQIPQVGPALVDVSYCSGVKWDKRAPDHGAARIALAKAAANGMDRALLITVEQNTQHWSWWLCSVPDAETFGAELRGEAEVLAATFAGHKVAALRKKGLPITVEPAYSLQLKADTYIMERAKSRSASMRKGGVISPSEISTTTCDRRIGYALRATERRATLPTMLYRIFDYGTSAHEVMQRLLQRGLPRLLPEVQVKAPHLMIQGSADLMDPPEETCIELKSMSTNQFVVLKDKKDEHKVQGTIYSKAGDTKYKYSAYDYMDKETYEIKEFSGRVDEGTWHKVAARSEGVVKAHKAGDLLPRTQDKSQCTECPFTWTCTPGDASQNEPTLLKNLRTHAREHRS